MKVPCIKHTRVLRYWKERQELYLGHSGGIVSVYICTDKSPQLVCKSRVTVDSAKLHDDDITQITILKKKNKIVTISKDKVLKIWDLPKVWVEESLLNSNINNTPPLTPTTKARQEEMSNNENSLGGYNFDPQSLDD